MASACSLLFIWQSSGDLSGNDLHLIMKAEWIIAGVMLLMIVGLLIVGLVALSYIKKIMTLAEDLQAKALPLISKSTDLVDDIGPKVRSITTNVEEISFSARSKVDEIGQTITQINRTVMDINAKAQVQSSRVDVIVTDALATTRQVSETVQHGIRVPLKQVAGIIAGFKAGLQTLAERSPFKPGRNGVNRPGSYDL